MIGQLDPCIETLYKCATTPSDLKDLLSLVAVCKHCTTVTILPDSVGNYARTVNRFKLNPKHQTQSLSTDRAKAESATAMHGHTLGGSTTTDALHSHVIRNRSSVDRRTRTTP